MQSPHQIRPRGGTLTGQPRPGQDQGLPSEVLRSFPVIIHEAKGACAVDCADSACAIWHTATKDQLEEESFFYVCAQEESAGPRGLPMHILFCVPCLPSPNSLSAITVSWSVLAIGIL